MTSTAILILVVGVLSIEGGAVRIDAGQEAGLRVGDQGLVFYELKVRDESRRVEVGSAEVVEVAACSAIAQVTASAEVRAGYRVEFSIPLERRGAPPPPPESRRRDAETADLGRRLSAAEGRNATLEGQVREAGERSASLETSLEEARSHAAAQERRADAAEAALAAAEAALGDIRIELEVALAEQQRLETESRDALAAAAGSIALLTAELEAAAAVAAVAEPPPAAEPAPESAHGGVESPDDAMLRVEGDEYRVGRAAAEATFYNQTPAFSVRLDSFRVDPQPVVAGSGFETGVSFAEAEAHCRARGARLPTEVEWEVAMGAGGLEGIPDLLEWTSSWYEPYPGNAHPEADYGKGFRVLRASGGDRFERRYMLPEARDSAVGFRCVSNDSTP